MTPAFGSTLMEMRRLPELACVSEKPRSGGIEKRLPRKIFRKPYFFFVDLVPEVDGGHAHELRVIEDGAEEPFLVARLHCPPFLQPKPLDETGKRIVIGSRGVDEICRSWDAQPGTVIDDAFAHEGLRRRAARGRRAGLVRQDRARTAGRGLGCRDRPSLRPTFSRKVFRRD